MRGPCRKGSRKRGKSSALLSIRPGWCLWDVAVEATACFVQAVLRGDGAETRFKCKWKQRSESQWEVRLRREDTRGARGRARRAWNLQCKLAMGRMNPGKGPGGEGFRPRFGRGLALCRRKGTSRLAGCAGGEARL